MRAINTIFLHCSDSDNPLHDDIKVIRKWHTERGFVGPDGIRGTEDDIGYHWFIDRNGTAHPGRNEKQVGAHVKNHNQNSIGVCLSGRIFNDFHSEQFNTARDLVEKLLKKYNLTKKDVKLHNQVDAGKTCPNFTLDEFWQK